MCSPGAGGSRCGVGDQQSRWPPSWRKRGRGEKRRCCLPRRSGRLARLARRRARWRAKRLAGWRAGGWAGGGASAPSRAAFKQKTSPSKPPAARSPHPLLWSPRPGSPVQRPDRRPGLPPRSRLPWREGSAEPGEPRAKRRSPRSLARTPPPPPRAGRAPCPPTPGRLGKIRTAAPPPHRTVPRQTAPACARSRLPARPPAAPASDSVAVAVVATALPSRGWRPGCQAPTAARRALTHTHTAAGWPRLGISGRTDPFPLFFSPPNFHVFISGLGHY